MDTNNKKIIIMALSLSLKIFSFNQVTHWLFQIIPIALLLYISKFQIRQQQKQIIFYFSLFLAWIIITGLLSESYYLPLKKSIEIAFSIIFLMSIFINIKTEQDFIEFLNSTMYSGFIISIYVIGKASTLSFNINFDELLVGKNTTALHLIISLIAIIFLAKITTTKKVKYAVLYITIFSTVVITLSVKSIIALLFITVFFIVKNKKFLVLLFFTVSMIFLYKPAFIEEIESSKSYFFVSNKIQAALGNKTNTFADDAVHFRNRIKNDALQIFYENPFFGIGLENSRNQVGTYSHHHWIELLVGGGILALVLYIVPIAYTLILIYKKRKRHRLFDVALLIILVIAIYSQAQRLYDSYSFMILFAMLLSSAFHKNYQSSKIIKL